MSVINRLYQYLQSKNIKPTRFEKDIGISNGYLGTQFRRNADIGSSILAKILKNCPDLNPDWLILGKGEMFRLQHPVSERTGSASPPCATSKKPPGVCEECLLRDKIISSLEQTVASQQKTIAILEESLKEARQPHGQKREAG